MRTSRLQQAARILGVVLISAVASTACAQTVEEIIAKNIKAQGGREALMGLKGIQRKGTIKVDGAFGQMEGTVEETSVPWKKALRSLDLTVFAQKDGWDGKVTWRDGMMGVQEISGQEANQVKQVADLNPLVMLKERDITAEKGEDKAIDGVDCCSIKLTPKDGPPITMFIDKKTDLIKRTTLKQNNEQFGEIEVVVDISDYQKFGTVTLPTKNKAQLGDAFKFETTYTETKVNPTIDEKIFDMPKKAD